LVRFYAKYGRKHPSLKFGKMKYNLQLVTASPQLEPIIVKAENDLFELVNRRNDAIITSRKAVEASERKSKALAKSTSAMDRATRNFNNETDPKEKLKFEAEIKKQEGNLIKLNIPDDVAPLDELIAKSFDKEQLDLIISGQEDFIAALKTRKDELIAAGK